MDALHEITAPAGLTDAVFTAEEADTNPLPDLPACNVRTGGIDTSDHFVTWHAWIRNAREVSVDRGHIRMTDTTRFYPDANLFGTWIHKRTFNGAKCARCCHFDGLVVCPHRDLLSGAVCSFRLSSLERDSTTCRVRELAAFGLLPLASHTPTSQFARILADQSGGFPTMTR